MSSRLAETDQASERMLAVLCALRSGTVTPRASLRDRLKDCGFDHYETVRRCCLELAALRLCHRTVTGAWHLSVPIPGEGRLIGHSPVMTQALTAVHHQTQLSAIVHGATPAEGGRYCLGLMPSQEYMRALARAVARKGRDARYSAALLTNAPLSGSNDAPTEVIRAYLAGNGPRGADIRDQGWAYTRVAPAGWWALSVPIGAGAGALSVLSPGRLRTVDMNHHRRVLAIAAARAGHALTSRPLSRSA